MEQSSTNLLISSMSAECQELLLSRCQRLTLNQRTVCYEAEERPSHVYFLEGGFASVVCTMQNGESAEVEMIGREGLVGANSLLGDSSVPTPTRCFIQVAGQGWRIVLSDLQEMFLTSDEIRKPILSFFQRELSALGQIAGCHRMHNAEERLVRWLLMAQDRVGASALHLTHEFLAEMLGTRRTTVTEVAGGLQRRGLIEYQRGTVVIADRLGLEAAACECYGILRKIYSGLNVRGEEARGLASNHVS